MNTPHPSTSASQSPAGGALPRFFRAAGRLALSVLAGAAGFSLAATLVGEALPAPYGFQASPKMEHFTAHRNDYDAIFCGSSRVLRHVIPAEFDAKLAAAGRPLRSFNMGVDAMPPPESFYYLRQILALRPRVRWIFIELWDIRSMALAASLDQQRFINWHDLRHTALVLRRLFTDERLALPVKLDRARYHLIATFRRCSHQGRGGEWLGPRLEDDARTRRKKAAFREPTPWRDRAGFTPGPPEVFPSPKRAAYETAVQTIRTGFPTSPLEDTLRDAVAALAREVRAIGAEPVFVVMPTVHAGENYAPLRAQGIDAELISLASPQRFPELYETRVHNDDWHLTEEGAGYFTHYLAQEFVALLRARAAAAR